MVRADHVDIKIHLFQRLEGLENHRRIRKNNVGVVGLHQIFEEGAIHLIGKTLAGGPVLTERIVGERDLVFRAVGQHGVRPVQHAGFHELQGALAKRNFGAGGHDFNRPVLVMEVSLHCFLPHGGGVDFLRLVLLNGKGEATGMIRLKVIDDEVVDLAFGAKNMSQIALHRTPELFSNSIDQGNFLVLDQEVVIRGAFVGNGVTVKVTAIPIHHTCPENSFFNFNWSHSFLRIERSINRQFQKKRGQWHALRCKNFTFRGRTTATLQRYQQRREEVLQFDVTHENLPVS